MFVEAEMDTRTGTYAGLGEREDRHRHDNDRLRSHG